MKKFMPNKKHNFEDLLLRQVPVENNPTYIDRYNIDLKTKSIAYDFRNTLWHYVNTTYIEEIVTDQDILGHFLWCFDKASNEICERYDIKIEDDKEYQYYEFENLRIMFYMKNQNNYLYYENYKDYIDTLDRLDKPKSLNDFEELKSIEELFTRRFCINK